MLRTTASTLLWTRSLIAARWQGFGYYPDKLDLRSSEDTFKVVIQST